MENTTVNGNENVEATAAAAESGGAYQNKAVEEHITLADAEYLRMMREGKYPEIISAMENLGKYSLRNMLLILSQNPSATNVAGMREWNYHSRSIIAGQKGIKVLAPRFKEDKIIEDENGKASYMLNTVFDISQTHGKELKQIRCTAEFAEANFDGLKDVIASLADGYTFIENGKYNTVDYAKKTVTLKEGLSQTDILKGMIYAVASIRTEGKDREAAMNVSQGKQMFNEIEATAVTNIVSRRVGLGDFKLKAIDFSGYEDSAIERFANNLHRIKGLSQKLINNIEQFVSDIESESAAETLTEPAAETNKETASDDSAARKTSAGKKTGSKQNKQAEKGGMEL